MRLVLRPESVNPAEQSSLVTQHSAQRIGGGRTLGAADAPLRRAVFKILRSGSSDNRILAARVVSGWRQKAIPASRALLRASRSDKSEVARAAIEGLGRLGLPSRAVVRQLARYLRHKQMQVRLASINALRQIGPAAASVHRFVARAAAKDSHPLVRIAALHTLIVIRPIRVRDHVRQLARFASKGSYAGREAAVRALGQVGPLASDVVPVLITAFTHGPMTVRIAAAVALTQLGRPASSRVIKRLWSLRDASHRSLRRAVWTALARLAPESALPFLTLQLASERTTDRADAIEALGSVPRETRGRVFADAKRALNRMVNDPYENLRLRHAARAAM